MDGRKWQWQALVGGVVLACGAPGLLAQGPVPVAPQASREATPAVPATASATTAARPLAVVNGEVITSADLEMALKQAGPSPVALTEVQVKQMKLEYLRLLMDAALMRQFLTK